MVWADGRVRGYVEHVAPTDSFVLVWDGAGVMHVPLALGLSVRRPHFSVPEDGARVAPRCRSGVPVQLVGQLEFDFGEVFGEAGDQGGGS